MRHVRSLCLSIGLLAGAAFGLSPGKALAKGGEDFPFFCSLDFNSGGMAESFQLVPDNRSDSGYAMLIYTKLNFTAWVPAYLDETQDGKYWVVYARQHHFTVLFDRQILAYVAKDPAKLSHGDVHMTLRNARGGDWYLKPMRCDRPNE